MIKLCLKIHELLLRLCRFVTRHECYQRRLQVAEAVRWVDASFAHRARARQRFDQAMMNIQD